MLGTDSPSSHPVSVTRLVSVTPPVLSLSFPRIPFCASPNRLLSYRFLFFPLSTFFLSSSVSLISASSYASVGGYEGGVRLGTRTAQMYLCWNCGSGGCARMDGNTMQPCVGGDRGFVLLRVSHSEYCVISSVTNAAR